MKKSRPTIVIMLMAFTAFVADSGCHKKVASAPATAPPPQAAPAPPATPSAPATASRNTEAPAPAPAPSLDQLFRQNVKDAFFDYNKSDIRQDAKQALVADAEFLRAHPQVRFVIEGHCDERGSEEYNLGLGDRRATAAKRYLVNLGIPDSRIQTTSFGKEHPFCTEHDESCWQQNRRGHMTMTP